MALTAAVDEGVFEELNILLRGEDGFHLGEHFLLAVGAEFLGFFLYLLLLILGFLLDFSLVGLAFGLESIYFGLLLGGEVEAFEGVEGGLVALLTLFGFLTLFALLGGALVAVGLSECLGQGGGGAEDGGDGEHGACDYILFHKLYLFLIVNCFVVRKYRRLRRFKV